MKGHALYFYMLCALFMSCKPRVQKPGIQKHASNLTKEEIIAIPRPYFSLMSDKSDEKISENIKDIQDVKIDWSILSLGKSDFFVPEAHVEWSQKGVLNWSLSKIGTKGEWIELSKGLTYRSKINLSTLYSSDFSEKYSFSIRECSLGRCSSWSFIQFSILDFEKTFLLADKSTVKALEEEEKIINELSLMSEMIAFSSSKKFHTMCGFKLKDKNLERTQGLLSKFKVLMQQHMFAPLQMEMSDFQTIPDYPIARELDVIGFFKNLQKEDQVEYKDLSSGYRELNTNNFTMFPYKWIKLVDKVGSYPSQEQILTFKLLGVIDYLDDLRLEKMKKKKCHSWFERQFQHIRFDLK